MSLGRPSRGLTKSFSTKSFKVLDDNDEGDKSNFVIQTKNPLRQAPMRSNGAEGAAMLNASASSFKRSRPRRLWGDDSPSADNDFDDDDGFEEWDVTADDMNGFDTPASQSWSNKNNGHQRAKSLQQSNNNGWPAPVEQSTVGNGSRKQRSQSHKEPKNAWPNADPFGSTDAFANQTDNHAFDDVFSPSAPQQTTQQSVSKTGPVKLNSVQYRMQPLESMDDLLERCNKAKEENWVKELTLAQIRSRLGFPLRKLEMTPGQIGHLKSLYIEFVKDIRRHEENSRFLQPMLGSSADEPNPAIVLFQFLYYADCDPDDSDLTRFADIIAKDPTIGAWCREILRYPNDFHGILLECALGHLTKMSFIIDKKEKEDFIKTVIFRQNKKRKERMNTLREDLLNVVTRNDGAGAMTISHALYLHNSVEVVIYGKNETNPLTKKMRKKFRKALEAARSDFPSDARFQQVMFQLAPYCGAVKCLKRGPYECCGGASYCSQMCRDDHWKKHKKVCEHGKNNKVHIDFPGSATEPKQDASAPQNTFEDDFNNLPWDGDNDKKQEKQTSSNFEDEFNNLPWDGDLPPAPEPVRGGHMSQLDMHKSFEESFKDFNHYMASALEEPKVEAKPAEPTAAQKKQDSLLFASPGIVYFILQDWGNIGIQLKSPEDKNFRKLRQNALEDHANVREMLRILVECCPNLEADIRAQLEKEYEISLGKGGMKRSTSRRDLGWGKF